MVELNVINPDWEGVTSFFVALSHDNIAYKVVSTLVSDDHFSQFPTVKPNSKGLSFLSLTSLLFKKIPVETESSLYFHFYFHHTCWQKLLS